MRKVIFIHFKFPIELISVFEGKLNLNPNFFDKIIQMFFIFFFAYILLNPNICDSFHLAGKKFLPNLIGKFTVFDPDGNGAIRIGFYKNFRSFFGAVTGGMTVFCQIQSEGYRIIPI